MSETPLLVARARTEFGKGFARRARRDGMVPGVIYGPGAEPLHVELPAHELFLVVRSTKGARIDVELDGTRIETTVKEVQVHPVRRDILHVDLVRA